MSHTKEKQTIEPDVVIPVNDDTRPISASCTNINVNPSSQQLQLHSTVVRRRTLADINDANTISQQQQRKTTAPLEVWDPLETLYFVTDIVLVVCGVIIIVAVFTTLTTLYNPLYPLRALRALRSARFIAK